MRRNKLPTNAVKPALRPRKRPLRRKVESVQIPNNPAPFRTESTADHRHPILDKCVVATPLRQAVEQTNPLPNLPDLVSYDELARVLRLSKKTLKRLRDEGNFPRPLDLGNRKLVWIATEVREWIYAQRTVLGVRRGQKGESDK